MESEITLGSQHVEAFRLFQLDWKNLNLHSLNINKKDPWLPGEVKRAVCIHAQAHGFLKPVADCGCGIWSCKSRKALNETFKGLALVQLASFERVDDFFPWQRFHHGPFYISARVEQWGVVIEHEIGYRSEYARIIPQTIQVWPRRNNKRYHALVKELRRKYSS